MYARVNSFQVHQGQMEERLRHTQEQAWPMVRERPGQRGILLLLDRPAHKSVTITLWQTEEDLDAFERHEETRQRLGHRTYAANEPQVERFDVAEYMPGSSPDAARYARVTSYHVQTGRMEERTRHQQERMTPTVAAQPGYAGRLTLVDNATHKVMNVTLWETEQARQQAFEQAAVQETHPHQHFGASDQVTELFEVAHQG